MKTLLKISIALNLALAGGLTYALLNVSQPVFISAPQAVVTSQPVINEKIAVATPNPPPAEPKPFRWSQLDAKDYHVYVKNLRDIGCPEVVLRSIVTADVHAAFRQYGLELKQQLGRLAGTSWTNQLANADSEQMLKNRLQQLPSEEVAKMDDYLDLPPAAAPTFATLALALPSASGGNGTSVNLPNTSSSAGSPGVDPTVADMSVQVASTARPLIGHRQSPEPVPVAYPLVFQPVSPAANLTEAQTQVINNLRQEFMDNIGGPNQNPNDPAYLKLWQQAQAQTDQMTEVQLGYNAYINYWINQYQASLASQSAAQ